MGRHLVSFPDNKRGLRADHLAICTKLAGRCLRFTLILIQLLLELYYLKTVFILLCLILEQMHSDQFLFVISQSFELTLVLNTAAFFRFSKLGARPPRQRIILMQLTITSQRFRLPCSRQISAPCRPQSLFDVLDVLDLHLFGYLDLCLKWDVRLAENLAVVFVKQHGFEHVSRVQSPRESRFRSFRFHQLCYFQVEILKFIIYSFLFNL